MAVFLYSSNVCLTYKKGLGFILQWDTNLLVEG